MIKKFIEKLEKEVYYLKNVYILGLDYLPLTKAQRDDALSDYNFQIDVITDLIKQFKKKYNI